MPAVEQHQQLTAHLIPIELVKPDPEQPRKYFKPEAIESLANSIRRFGLQNPIHVRQLPDGTFMIVGGERRYRAHLALGRSHIAAFVKPDDTNTLVFEMVDNVEREPLNPLEEAQGYQKFLDRDLSRMEISEMMCRSEGHITSCLGYLRLPPKLQDDLARGGLKPTVAKTLLRHCRDPDEMLSISEAASRRYGGISKIRVKGLLGIIDVMRENQEGFSSGRDEDDEDDETVDEADILTAQKPERRSRPKRGRPAHGSRAEDIEYAFNLETLTRRVVEALTALVGPDCDSPNLSAFGASWIAIPRPQRIRILEHLATITRRTTRLQSLLPHLKLGLKPSASAKS